MAKPKAESERLTGRILAVDCVARARGVLLQVLTKLGYQATAASSEEMAFVQIGKQYFDLVIVGVHLARPHTLELLERIRSGHPHISIVALIREPTFDIALAALRQGAVDIIPKPCTSEEIDQTVQRVLIERRRLMDTQQLIAALGNKAVIEDLNRQLQLKVDHLGKLYQLSESFQSLPDNSQMFQYIIDVASELTGARRVSFLVYSPADNTLVVRASKGLSVEDRESSCKLGDGVAGGVAANQRPLRVTTRESADALRGPGREHYATSSWMSLPLFIGKELLGVLNLTDKEDRSDFGDEDEYLLEMLAQRAGTRVENNLLYRGMYDNLLDTLRALVSTIEAKDPYTRYHSQRVTDTALVLARRLGLGDEVCDSISFAGPLHDIGKIGVRDHILGKPGSLTDSEYATIKTHPAMGEGIVDSLGLTATERHIIRHHHERFDGSGYPDGLRGDDIPLVAQVVALADAFDAMTSTRAYRQAMSLPTALEELRRGAGTQFAPALVVANTEAVASGELHVYAGAITPARTDGPATDDEEKEVVTEEIYACREERDAS